MPAAGLPDLDLARVRKWCDGRVPDNVRDEVRVEVDIAPRHLTIVECRPPWHPDKDREWTRAPIARLRYSKSDQTWTLYWADSKDRFHRYDGVDPSERVDDLLEEIDHDPTCIFWG